MSFNKPLGHSEACSKGRTLPEVCSSLPEFDSPHVLVYLHQFSSKTEVKAFCLGGGIFNSHMAENILPSENLLLLHTDGLQLTTV